jgi:uncharacterized protein YjbJ (UPF0337 family)
MNWDQIEARWEQFRGKALTQWGRLNHSDVDVVAGKRTELAGRIQIRYGVAREDAENQIDSWMRSL